MKGFIKLNEIALCPMCKHHTYEMAKLNYKGFEWVCIECADQ
jgi:hypothetical protein